jgi:hypothetical protein
MSRKYLKLLSLVLVTSFVEGGSALPGENSAQRCARHSKKKAYLKTMLNNVMDAMRRDVSKKDSHQGRISHIQKVLDNTHSKLKQDCGQGK